MSLIIQGAEPAIKSSFLVFMALHWGCVCENMSHYSAYEAESRAEESVNIFEYLKANMTKTEFNKMFFEIVLMAR